MSYLGSSTSFSMRFLSCHHHISQEKNTWTCAWLEEAWKPKTIRVTLSTDKMIIWMHSDNAWWFLCFWGVLVVVIFCFWEKIQNFLWILDEIYWITQKEKCDRKCFAYTELWPRLCRSMHHSQLNKEIGSRKHFLKTRVSFERRGICTLPYLAS